MKKLYLISTLLVIFGCTSENDILLKQNSFLDNFLTFDNQQDFETQIKINNDLMSSERQKWESRMNFSSLLSLHEMAMAEEEDQVKKLMLMGNPTDNQINNIQIKTINENKGSFTFVEDGWFTPNIIRYEAASVVNKDGLVMIGDILYQYKMDEIKSIRVMDPSKIEDYSESIMSSNSNSIMVDNDDYYVTDNNVFVSRVKNIPLNGYENARRIFSDECSDSFFPKVKGYVSLNYVANTPLAMYPCGSFQCYQPNLCFLNKCEGPSGASTYTSICEQSMKLKWGPFTFSGPKRMSASYRIGSGTLIRLPDKKGNSSTLRRTIFNESGLSNPINLSYLSCVNYDDDPNSFSSCPVGFSD